MSDPHRRMSREERREIRSAYAAWRQQQNNERQNDMQAGQIRQIASSAHDAIGDAVHALETRAGEIPGRDRAHRLLERADELVQKAVDALAAPRASDPNRYATGAPDTAHEANERHKGQR